MKFFKSSQIHEIDKYTIENEPITSLNLMERAAKAVFERITSLAYASRKFCVIIGPGNNGGDGLVIARLLLTNEYEVDVYVCRFTKSMSQDCSQNLNRLKKLNKNIVHEGSKSEEIIIPEKAIIIDAIFGSGLSRETSGEFAKVISKINNSGNNVISIDTPSGLFGEDNSNNNGAIVQANITYALQFPSISMMFAENSKFFGEIVVVPIGLSKEAIKSIHSNYYITDKEFVKANLKKRNRFDHKGNFGHLLLVAGSYGKAGAAVLAAKAALKTGAGLITAHLPTKLVDIMQISVPEVMISIDNNDKYCSNIENVFKYDAVGIGPGLDTKNISKDLLINILKTSNKPAVIDADALNILAEIKDFLNIINPDTILTPHPKEFERLFGKFDNSWKKIEFMQKISIEKSIIIVLKAGITTISLPDGRVFFNTSGNPGMATGGSGDVLTGIIASLVTQGYSSEIAAILGVYFHSKAGDIAKLKLGEMTLSASSIIENLAKTFLEFEIEAKFL
ncbi:MAG: NAD(P)H-hydrate dehydratase [Bacteroidales bacterium]|nr:NAD(P)H-hydrate dehydratase [Bacteroidales bacterium]